MRLRKRVPHTNTGRREVGLVACYHGQIVEESGCGYELVERVFGVWRAQMPPEAGNVAVDRQNRVTVFPEDAGQPVFQLLGLGVIAAMPGEPDTPFENVRGRGRAVRLVRQVR